MEDSGFDLLGADATDSRHFSVKRSLFALATGGLGMLLFPKHRVLAFLDGTALAFNAHAVATKERTLKEAAKRIGCHVVATAGSLALPQHPAIGYVAGAVAGDLLLDRDGNGLIDEWTHMEEKHEPPKPDNVVDAEIVTDNSKALVKK